MNKLVLIPIIIGAALVTAGGIALGVGLATAKTAEQKVNPYQFDEDFNNFNINLDTADFEIKASEGSEKKVVVEETEKYQHKVSVSNNTLSVIHPDEKGKWFENIFSFSRYKYKVTVYLPAGNYGEFKFEGATGDVTIPAGYTFNNVDIDISTGDIDFKGNVVNDLKTNVSTGYVKVVGSKAKTMNFTGSTGNCTLENVEVESSITANQSTGKFTMKNSKCKNVNIITSTGDQIYENVNVDEKMDLNVSTGDVVLTKVNCQNYKSVSSTGDVKLNEVLVAEHIDIETSTGDVDLYNSDAATLKIKTDTGHVKGNLLTDHIFYVTNNTGTPDVPKSTTGGLCEIETHTGSIRITIGAK